MARCGWNWRDRVALALPAHEARDRHVGVQGEQPDQLRADVPGRADDRDSDGVAGQRDARRGAALARRSGPDRGDDARSAAIAASVESALTGAPGRSRAAGSRRSEIGRNVVTA